ncbi:MAG TPA: hypothetical protein VN706_13295 [Gemmatimonadaceae bacterium]|nr:hypothetical protein [Gemmatimonadaceae bacterium]
MYRMCALAGTVAGTVACIAAASCALPRLGGDPIHERVYPASATTDSAAGSVRDDALIVQVREFPHSSTIAVLAWDVDDPDFGLRAEVSRQGGVLLGHPQFGNHLLYVSAQLVRSMGGFRHAIAEPNRALTAASTSRDTYACYFGTHCSPQTSTGVWLPDSILRAHRDSLLVTFVPAVNEAWTVTLHRELIEHYLQTVDSVVASVKQDSKDDSQHDAP